jgi:hypothetical protein
MTKVNWGRFSLGTNVAAVIAFMTDGFMHEVLLKSDWRVVYEALQARPPEDHGSSMIYFALFELGRGLFCALFYVLLRPRLGAGPRTAVAAGVAAWLAFSLFGPAQFVPLGFISLVLWTKLIGFQLLTTVIAALAAGALYKETP